MRFDLSDDQRLLQEGARKFMEKESPIAKVRAWEKSAEGFDRGLYRKMGELGWLGLALPESRGGTGPAWVELAAVLEEVGRALFPSPFHPSAVVSAVLLDTLAEGGGTVPKDLLPSIASGEKIVVLALVDGDGPLMKLFVPYAHAADSFIVQTPSGFHLVPSKAPGISLTRLEVMSGEPLLEVRFTEASLAAGLLLAQGERAREAMERASAAGAVAAAAEMVGGARRALEMGAEYVKTRIQFGQPVGKFQAVQHLLARPAVTVEGARLLMYEAAWAMGRASRGLAPRPLLNLPYLAKYWANLAYHDATKEAHQAMGGFGFMAETDLQLYYRRAKGHELNRGMNAEMLDLAASTL